MSRALAGGLAGLLAVAVLTGCGVPTSGEPRVIPASDVPYGLASPAPTTPTGQPTQTMLVSTAIYLVTPGDVLVERGRELEPGDRQARLEELLAELAAGPSAQERADELSTRLPPEVELQVTDLTGGTVTIDIAGPVDSPSGAESRLAVAQIVLTATSLSDVRAVQLTRQGATVDAPLPDGQLTSDPLTASDYAVFLTTPAPSRSPRSTPVPTTTPATTSPG